MKKFKYIAVCLTALAASSCGDWLDVQSKTEVKRDKLFETKSGFQSALTGAYIRLNGENKNELHLYSREMTFGTLEMLAQHWVKINEDYWRKYDYSDSRLASPLKIIFEEQYNVIKDVNTIIEKSETNRDVLTEGWYELVRGEALALRAFCHFDLLRLWGPVPGRETAETILPYVQAVTTAPNPYHTYSEYIKLLEKDLIEAEELLGKADPVLQYSINALNNPGNNTEGFNPDGDYWTSRQIRMNYYAVTGLMARFYLWIGNTDEAYRFAKIAIDAKDPNGEAKFRLAKESDLIPGLEKYDYMFSMEHLFAMRNYQLYSINSTYFTAGSADGAQSAVYYAYRGTLKTKVFEDNVKDIRYGLWEDTGGLLDATTVMKLKKFMGSETAQIFQMPLIRLAEMYMIAIETGPLEDARALYATFCASRNITPADVTDRSQFKALMLKEYNKEFYAEGQMFFAYKRTFEKEIIDAGVLGSDAVYVLPLPSGESKTE